MVCWKGQIPTCSVAYIVMLLSPGWEASTSYLELPHNILTGEALPPEALPQLILPGTLAWVEAQWPHG